MAVLRQNIDGSYREEEHGSWSFCYEVTLSFLFILAKECHSLSLKFQGVRMYNISAREWRAFNMSKTNFLWLLIFVLNFSKENTIEFIIKFPNGKMTSFK